MAKFALPNDRVATITILTRDAAGDVVEAPARDTFSVTSSNSASLGAIIGVDAAGHPAVILTPLVQQSPDLTVTVSDAAGLQAFTETVDIIQDTTPRTIGLDIGSAVEVDQPVPTNPGP